MKYLSYLIIFLILTTISFTTAAAMHAIFPPYQIPLKPEQPTILTSEEKDILQNIDALMSDI